MNPLSPYTYYRRHKGRALTLTALIALSVMGIYLLIGIFQESYVTPEYSINRYLNKFSLVQAVQGKTLDPIVDAQIRANPEIARVLPQNDVQIGVPNVGGLAFYFRLLGLRDADIVTVLEQSGVRLVEGKLPKPGTNGVALSREITAALDLEIGDTFDQTKDEEGFIPYYASIVSPLEVVGILSGDVRLGIMSYEYLDQQEGFRDLARYGVLVISNPGHEAEVDDFLQQTVQGSRTELFTFELLEEATASSQATLGSFFIPIMLLVTTAITLVVGAINQLAFMQRLPEFGTLFAVGRGKGWLARRLTLETMGIAVAGWALGFLLGLGLMAFLSAGIYAPKGFGFNPFQVTAFLLVLPVPLVVIGFTLYTAVRALNRMDAVAIVERGELSLEDTQVRNARKGRHGRAERLPKPLAATTFYLRHKRRAVTLIIAMALMIVGTAAIVFVVETIWDTGQPILNGLNRISRVYPQGQPLEAVEIENIRSHPAVERAIPATVVLPFVFVTPLIRDGNPLETFSVTQEDMLSLIALYELELEEGHLPRPGSNDIIIPWTAARNRNLHVGDLIGDPDHPIYPDAPALPSPLVVSGIFARPENPEEDVWMSFISLEFINDNAVKWNINPSLIIVPRSGEKAALDTWLEDQIASDRRIVLTYGNQQSLLQETLNTALFTFSLMESIIALVAALALAGLNYIFVIQRKAEFGVLNALGYTRQKLVWRITRETLFITMAAWLFGLLGCAIILAYMQYATYAPIGFTINFFNLTPWFYTLPIPVAVLVVSAAAVGWILSRLDPVAVIERR